MARLFLKKYFWVLAAIFALALSLWNFEKSPGFWFDEGIYSEISKNLAVHGEYGAQVSPGQFFTDKFWVTVSYPVLLPLAFFLKIFGPSQIFAARITPLLYLLGFVIVSYFFVKKFFGTKSAFFATMLLITFSPLYGNGKAVLGEIPALFWLILGAYFFTNFRESGRKSFFILSGLFWGMAIATKMPFLIFIPGLLAALGYLWLKEHSINFKQVLAHLVAFAIPASIWAFALLGPIISGFGKTSSYLLNNFGQESSFIPLIAKNLFRFVSESTPLHFLILAVAVFAAFLISFRRDKKFGPLIFMLLSFVVLEFLWYLKTPGWYRTFFPAHILLIILFPASLFSITSHFKIFSRPILKFFPYAILSVLIVIQAGHLFLNYNALAANDVLLVKKYVAENIPRDASILVMSQPQITFVIDHKNLYQFIFIRKGVVIGKNTLGKNNPDYFIIGRDDKQFYEESKSIIESDYKLLQQIGHYKIYIRRLGKLVAKAEVIY